MKINLKEEITKKVQNGEYEGLSNLLSGTRFPPQAIREAAKAGNSGLVNFLLSRQIANLAAKSFSTAEISLFNQALEGYALGLHFAEIKKMIEKGANIFHGLNALISSAQLTPENASALINCVKNEKQKMLLTNKIEALDCLPSASKEDIPQVPGIRY